MANRTIIELDTVATGDVTDAAAFETQDTGLSDPESRQLSLTQMRSLIHARTGVVFLQQSPPKAGTTAGWVVAAADNLGKMATLPASQTGSTLVVPVTGLKVGDIITGFYITGSIQSAGNTATLTADLRKLTAAAAGATDSSVGSLAAPVSVTANTILSSSNAGKTGLAHTVAAGESFYVLITSTTAASTTEEVQAVSIIVTTQA